MEPAQRPLRIPRRSLRFKIFADLRSFAPLGRRGRLPYVPINRAYKLRATPASVVPLMIARPSGNKVIS
jgi:hypothetical protein